jgi:hypothetical protein
MRVDPTRKCNSLVEAALLVICDACTLNWKPSIQDLDMATSQNIVDYSLIFFDSNGAGGVHNDPTGLAAVNSRSEKLTLKVASLANILKSLKKLS